MEVGQFVRKDLPFLRPLFITWYQPPSISSRSGRAIAYDYRHPANAINVEDLGVTLITRSAAAFNIKPQRSSHHPMTSHFALANPSNVEDLDVTPISLLSEIIFPKLLELFGSL